MLQTKKKRHSTYLKKEGTLRTKLYLISFGAKTAFVLVIKPHRICFWLKSFELMKTQTQNCIENDYFIVLFLQKEIPKPNASCEEKWEKYVDDLYFLQLFDKVVWNCIFSTVWQNLLSCTLMIIPTYL